MKPPFSPSRLGDRISIPALLMYLSGRRNNPCPQWPRGPRTLSARVRPQAQRSGLRPGQDGGCPRRLCVLVGDVLPPTSLPACAACQRPPRRRPPVSAESSPQVAPATLAASCVPVLCGSISLLFLYLASLFLVPQSCPYFRPDFPGINKT